MKAKDVGLIPKLILFEIISACHAANMPKSFISNIKLTQISELVYEIENAWTGENGEPLAVFFEYGTDRHWIEPKDPNGVLAWASGGPQSGSAQAIYSKRADNKKGNTLYSKGHYVNGVPPLEPMHQGLKIGMRRVVSEYG